MRKNVSTCVGKVTSGTQKAADAMPIRRDGTASWNVVHLHPHHVGTGDLGRVGIVPRRCRHTSSHRSTEKCTTIFLVALLRKMVLLEVVQVVSPALDRASHLRGEKHSPR